MALARAIGKPRAAEVATALCMATLHQVIKGTDTKPPPAPTKLDKNPMKPPTPNIPALLGRVRLGSGFLLSNIW